MRKWKRDTDSVCIAHVTLMQLLEGERAQEIQDNYCVQLYYDDSYYYMRVFNIKTKALLIIGFEHLTAAKRCIKDIKKDPKNCRLIAKQHILLEGKKRGRR